MKMIDINKTAKLACLRLTEEETVRFENELEKIIAFAAKLGELEPEKEEADMHLVNVFREDSVEGVLSRDELLKNSPDSLDGYFKVKRTVGGEEL